MFWKAYFCLIFINYFRNYSWHSLGRSWEIIDMLIFVMAMVGFFGFCWRKRIFTRMVWAVFFPIGMLFSLYYQCVVSIHPYVAAAAGGLSLAFWAIKNIAVYAPVAVALYLYSYKCRKLWESNKPTP
jgi:ABC-type polysaccharide/polyol phosphate export permease